MVLHNCTVLICLFKANVTTNYVYKDKCEVSVKVVGKDDYDHYHTVMIVRVICIPPSVIYIKPVLLISPSLL